MSRAGHHANALWDHEPSFDTAPSTPNPQIFGGNVTVDTNEGSHEAVRIFNADRKAAEIIEQVFDGAWSITGELGPEPPWWLSAVLGSPNSTNVAGNLYDHEYGLGVGGDLDSLRIYEQVEGFNTYREIPGCVVATFTIDQSVPGNPEFTISGAYAREPDQNSTLTLDVPEFSKRSFNNRLASLDIGADTPGLIQSTSITVETGTEVINELGTGHGVDFSPKVLAPSVDYEKIIATDQTVDLYQRFVDKNQVDVVLSYDNGESGDAQYRLEFTVGASFPDSWSRTGVNDPEADLSDDLNEMAEDFDAVITVDESSPP